MVIAKNDLRSRWCHHKIISHFFNERTPSPALPRNQVAGEGAESAWFSVISVIYPKITSNERSRAMGQPEVRPARIGSGRVAVGRTWPSAITYPALKCGVNKKRWGFVRFGQIILSAIGVIVVAKNNFRIW